MDFDEVLAAAARLQQLVPDAVLVGGTAASLYAEHRVFFDDDHVLADLRERFQEVLDVLEASEGGVTARVRPGKVILGSFDGIETRVLQLRRSRPLEVTELEVRGHRLRVPTAAEMLRVKTGMIVYRNATRDFLDTAALATRLGPAASGRTLARLDDYYSDQHEGGRGVATQVVRMLAEPRPYDLDAVDLSAYRRLEPRWQGWSEVQATCASIAVSVLAAVADEEGADVTGLALRHLDYGPAAGVQQLGAAGIQAVLDGGDLADWRPVLQAIAVEPWGPVSRRLERVLDHLETYGTAPLLRGWLQRCRAGTPEPAATLAELRREAGLTQRQLAARLGLSQAQVARVETSPSPSLRSLRRYLAGLGLTLTGVVAVGQAGFRTARLPASPEFLADLRGLRWEGDLKQMRGDDGPG